MSTERNITAPSSLLKCAAALRPLLAEGLANDLPGFAKEAWRVLHPGRPLIWSWHYDLLCEYLLLIKRRTLRRVIFNLPPRSAKSTLITIIYPVWTWLSEPEHDFLIVSYSLTLSTEHSIRRRNLLLSRWFQKLWKEKLQLVGGRNQAEQFVNNRGGQMIATSTGASVMGRGADLAILDDPLSAAQSLSAAERTRANNWIDTTLRSRLNDPAKGAIILVMQRLHQFDPTGFLLEQEPSVWTHVCIPLEAEKDETWTFPISGRVVQRKQGEILMRERFTPAVVEELRSRRMVFCGQYQQRPAPFEGNLIKHADVRYYGGIDPETGQPDEILPQNFDLKLLSVDCAFKDLATSDYVALLVIGVKGRKRFILELVNEHLDAAATEAEVRRLRNRHSPISAVIVEDKANGPAVIQRLQANIPGVVASNPRGGKIARMFAAAPEWQAHDWYIDRKAAWAESFIEQITIFPSGRYDDMVDSMSQAACWLASFTPTTVESYEVFTGRLLWRV